MKEDGKYKKENKAVYELYKENDDLIPFFALNINYKECFLSVDRNNANFNSFWTINNSKI